MSKTYLEIQCQALGWQGGTIHQTEKAYGLLRKQMEKIQGSYHPSFPPSHGPIEFIRIDANHYNLQPPARAGLIACYRYHKEEFFHLAFSKDY